MHHYAWWRAIGDGVDRGLYYFPQAEAQLTVFSHYYDLPSLSLRAAVYEHMQGGTPGFKVGWAAAQPAGGCPGARRPLACSACRGAGCAAHCQVVTLAWAEQRQHRQRRQLCTAHSLRGTPGLVALRCRQKRCGMRARRPPPASSWSRRARRSGTCTFTTTGAPRLAPPFRGPGGMKQCVQGDDMVATSKGLPAPLW